jgi:site-specific DNA recombinase
MASLREQQAERFRQRLTQLRKRLDQAYVDRLDGKIIEELWQAKSAEWQQEEQTILASLRELEQTGNSGPRSHSRTREQGAFSVRYADSDGKSEMLRSVLSNCAVDAVSVYPTYRKPFDMIFERAKTKDWWAWVDLNHRPHPYQGCALAT